MKLLGKRVERGNTHGNSLCLTLQESGHIKLSPALVSALGIKAGVSGANKVGFAYSEAGEATKCCIYAAIDGNGVSVNKQGRLYNMPHNRDIRNLLGFAMENDVTVTVDPDPETDVFEGYKLFNLDVDNSYHDSGANAHWNEESEEINNHVVDTTVDDIGNVKEEYKYSLGQEKTEAPKVSEFNPNPVVDGIAQDDEDEDLDMF